MTPLDWWMLGGSTAAGLVTVFRWQALAVAHAVRGAWLRLRDVGVDPIARHRLRYEPMDGQIPVREPEKGPPPPFLWDETPSGDRRYLECGCWMERDPGECPNRIAVSPPWSDPEYAHGGPR